jgi:hypothetical protein
MLSPSCVARVFLAALKLDPFNASDPAIGAHTASRAALT